MLNVGARSPQGRYVRGMRIIRVVRWRGEERGTCGFGCGKQGWEGPQGISSGGEAAVERRDGWDTLGFRWGAPRSRSMGCWGLEAGSATGGGGEGGLSREGLSETLMAARDMLGGGLVGGVARLGGLLLGLGGLDGGTRSGALPLGLRGWSGRWKDDREAVGEYSTMRLLVLEFPPRSEFSASRRATPSWASV